MRVGPSHINSATRRAPRAIRLYKVKETSKIEPLVSAHRLLGTRGTPRHALGREVERKPRRLLGERATPGTTSSSQTESTRTAGEFIHLTSQAAVASPLPARQQYAEHDGRQAHLELGSHEALRLDTLVIVVVCIHSLKDCCRVSSMGTHHTRQPPAWLSLSAQRALLLLEATGTIVWMSLPPPSLRRCRSLRFSLSCASVSWTCDPRVWSVFVFRRTFREQRRQPSIAVSCDCFGRCQKWVYLFIFSHIKVHTRVLALEKKSNDAT